MSRILSHSLVFILAAGLTLGQTSASSLREPRMILETKRAFRHVYNLDYDEAFRAFQALRSDYPTHPGPPLYLATTIWLRELFDRNELDLDLFLAPGYFDQPTQHRMPVSKRSSFLEYLDETQRLAGENLAANPGDKDARYFLGSSHGIRASFAITIDHDRGQAFSHGKKAYQIHSSLIEEDPDYFDAYLTVGLYEYIVGNLPWYIKWLAAILGYSGSKERGFQYLSTAVEKGLLVSEDARVLQMVLLVRERMFDKALEQIRQLQGLAPKNFILRLNEAQIYEKMGVRERAVSAYLNILEAAERRVPNFDKVPLKKFRGALGERLLLLHEPARALSTFQVMSQSTDLTDAERVVSILREGQALDLLGRREEAVSRYWKVLEMEDFRGSRRIAKRHLSKPYQ